MLKVAAALPNEPYREYKDVERVYSGSTEIDKILDKNGNVLFAVNKEVEGTPAPTYKGKEETNLKNYRIYGQTSRNLFNFNTVTNGYRITWATGALISDETAIMSDFIPVKENVYQINIQAFVACYNSEKNYLGVYSSNGYIKDHSNPVNSFTIDNNCKYVRIFTFTSKGTPVALTQETMLNSGSTLLPYEPYGESVGDRTENLFDSNINVISGYLSDEGILKPAKETSQITFDYIPIISGTYTFTYTVPSAYELWFGVCTYDESRTFQSRLVSEYSGAATFTIPDTTKYIRISLRGYNKTPIIMLNTGSTAIPYEPYGYKVPVTVTNGTDTQTTNLYLPEPIKMVGDEAEYIDFGEQKQHRVRKNLANNKHTGTPVNYTITENDNYIHAVGTNTTSNIQAIVLSSRVDLEAGEYDLVNNSSAIINADYYDENSIAQHFNVPSNSIKTFTYPSNVTRALNVYRAISAGNSIDAYFQVMIVKHGNDTTIYEPYIENTEVDVTLPELPTLSGTNTLTVGTEVQPSNVYLKGRIKEIA